MPHQNEIYVSALLPHSVLGAFLGGFGFLLFETSLCIALNRLGNFHGRQHNQRERADPLLNYLYFFWNHLLAPIYNIALLYVAIRVGRVVYPLTNSIQANSQPILLQLLELYLLSESIAYALHRAFHSSSLLWRYHKVHHAVAEFDAFCSSRIHVVELLVTRLAIALPILSFGFSPAIFLLYIGLISVHSLWAHSDFVGSESRIDFWFVTPGCHWVHHCAGRGKSSCNFAASFAFLDRIFGTYRPPTSLRFSTEKIIAAVPKT